MLPGCTVKINAVPEGKLSTRCSRRKPQAWPQPIRPWRRRPCSAVSAGALKLSLETYRLNMDVLQQVLLGCTPGAKCPPEGKTVPKILADQPSIITPQAAGRLASLNGPIAAAGHHLREPTSGIHRRQAGVQEVGWGRVNKSNLRDILFLQDVTVDLQLRTPYMARAAASNLMSHMFQSMQQAVSGKAVPGALGKPGDKCGASGSSATIPIFPQFAGMLGVDWLLEGYHPEQPPAPAARSSSRSGATRPASAACSSISSRRRWTRCATSRR